MDEELLSGVGSVLAALFRAYNEHFHQFVALLPSQVRGPLPEPQATQYERVREVLHSSLSWENVEDDSIFE